MWRENIIIAIRSLLGNKLRSGLTIAIIAIGITSLVGIQTSIEVMVSLVADFYENIGVKSFTIFEKDDLFQGERDGRIKNEPYLKYSEVKHFTENYNIPSKKCIFIDVSEGEVAKFGSIISDPVVNITAVEGDYLEFATLKILEGRYFTARDYTSSENVCIIGADLAKKLFKNHTPLNNTIAINNNRFRVVGTLESVGTLINNNNDWGVFIPTACAQRGLLSAEASYTVGVIPIDTDMVTAINEAGVLFRGCRGLSSFDTTDFKIETTDAIERKFSSIKSTLSLVALVVGLITILGAAIGLMNIMLVTVRERTREIGIRKTLGATNNSIRTQFLIESVLIGQIGGVCGIVLGIIIGNTLSFFLGSKTVLPWQWIFLSILICMTVSILSGYIPAKRAALLDPIEALRHE